MPAEHRGSQDPVRVGLLVDEVPDAREASGLPASSSSASLACAAASERSTHATTAPTHGVHAPHARRW